VFEGETVLLRCPFEPTVRPLVPKRKELSMKVNLIGMILNNMGRRYFDGLVMDDNGMPLMPADSLHTLIMEYAKVVNGGKSDLVVASREVSTPSPLMRLCGLGEDSAALAAAGKRARPNA